jgi:hypothetical protein
MKQLKNVLVFFFFIVHGIGAMELETSLSQFSPKLSPQLSPRNRRCDTSSSNHNNNSKLIHELQAFNFARQEKDISSGIMIISPVKDDKSVVLSKKNGIVSLFSFRENKEKPLINHHWVKHIPMIVAAQRKGSLLIVAAGNYMSSDHIKKSECYVWHEGSFRNIETKPLQAIAVNNEGSLLAIADQSHSISLVDLVSNKQTEPYHFFSVNKSERLVDIAFNPDGTKLILAKTNELVLMGCDKGRLDTIKRFSNIIDIKNVYFPFPGKVVYLTDDQQVKTVSLFEVSEGLETPRGFFEKLVHDRVTIDEAAGDTVALWTKNPKASGELRHQIVVRKKYSNKTEELVFEVPEFRVHNTPTPDEKYEYISKKGCLKDSIHHLTQVALRGNNLVALGSNGKLYWWNLVEDDNNKDAKEPLLDTLDEMLQLLKDDKSEEKSDKSDKSSLLVRSDGIEKAHKSGRRFSGHNIRARSKSEELDKKEKKSVFDMLSMKKSDSHGEPHQALPRKSVHHNSTEEKHTNVAPQGFKDSVGSLPKGFKDSMGSLPRDNKKQEEKK